MPDPTIAAILAHVPAGGTKRSPLYLWMRKRHDALQATFAENGPNWPALAQAFAAEGLTDRTGKPASVRRARKTWYRVVRDVAKARAEKPGKPEPLPDPPPSVRPIAQPTPEGETAVDPDNPYGFRPAGPKDWTKKGSE